MINAPGPIGNENGKTAIIIIIVLAVVGYLAYPGINAGYYNAKAEQSLKDLHSACNRHWSEGIAQQMVSKATGIKKEMSDCALGTITKSPINFQVLEGMTLEIVDGTKTGFQATGQHKEGDKLIKINAQGKIVS